MIGRCGSVTKRNITIQYQQSDTQNEKNNERAPEGNKTDDDSQLNDMQ